MTEPIIERARKPDIEGIQAAAVLSWHATYRGIFSPETIASHLQRGYSTDALGEAIRDRGSTFLVAKDAGRIVGFAQWGQRAGEAELFRMYIVPDHWRQGLGSALLRLMEQEWATQGVSRYFCLVHSLNGLGQAFYIGHGFTHTPSKDRDDHWYVYKTLRSSAQETLSR